MKKKRKKGNGFKVSITILLVVGLWTVIIAAILISQGLASEQTIRCNYEKREEIIAGLNLIADKCITEGEQFDFEEVNSDVVKHNITNTGENIIIDYWVEEGRYTAIERKYDAKIIVIKESYTHEQKQYKGKVTLTKEYKIISKEISPKSMTYEEYEKEWRNTEIAMVLLLSIIFLINILIIVFIGYYIIKKWKKNSNNY